MRRFISKGEWFDKDTEAKLIAQYIFAPGTNNGELEGDPWGLFEGSHNGVLDEECCGFDEFIVIEEIQNESAQKY